jgi:AcrR family transcriptional regulator
MCAHENGNDWKNSEIIHAAQEVFREHGFKKVTVDDIAQKLGMTRSSLYYYYKSKEDLLIAAFRADLDAYGSELKDHAGRKSTTEDRLIAVAECYARFHRKLINNYRLTPEDFYAYYRTLKVIKDETISLIRISIDDVLANDPVIADSRDIDYLSNILNMSMRGIVFNSQGKSYELLRRELVCLCRIFYHGLCVMPVETGNVKRQQQRQVAK